MPWGYAAAAVGGALVSGVMADDTAEDVSHASSQSTQASINAQKEMYQATRGDLAPYRDAGAPALQRLMHLTGIGTPQSGVAGFGSLTKDFTLADFSKDPGYEFRKAEGEKAIARGAKARGLNVSSWTLKNLMRYNQDLASSEFGAAYSRFEGGKSQKFNVLSYLAGTGQNAAAMTGQAGVNTGAGVSQSILAGGAGQANAAMISGTGWNNAIQGGMANYMYQKRWDDMMSRFPVFGQTSSPPAQSGGMVGDFPMSMQAVG